jgi:hypothetical protein
VDGSWPAAGEADSVAKHGVAASASRVLLHSSSHEQPDCSLQAATQAVPLPLKGMDNNLKKQVHH